MKPLVIGLWLLAALPGQAADQLAALVRFLGETRDPQVQLDVLRGLRDATQGRPRLPMPAGWEATEARLIASDQAEVRALTRGLGLTFGSENARAALRATLVDSAVDVGQRQDALRALAAVRDPSLPATLRGLLGEPNLRGAAIRALAGFDDPATSPALLAAYPSLAGAERRDAIHTLAARAGSARLMLGAVGSGVIPRPDLTAEVIRQLRSLKDEGVNAALTEVYGAFREVAADTQAEIERYKRLYWAGGSQPGDAIRGRAVYAKVCQQCHVLFDVGGKVGPDLTGSNRGDLEYLLQNILDPNAVIPNEYRASTFELSDGRVVTGILRQQDDKSLTVATATEVLTLPRADVVESDQSQLSMMPEGLLAPLADQEYRDLIYYLGRPGQTPLLATPDTVGLFYNGQDLGLWNGPEGVWMVEGGEIVGRQAAGATPSAEALRSDILSGDFRLVLQAKIEPADLEATLFFRAEPTPDGQVRGYALGIGGSTWGQLREEGGRGVLAGAQGGRPAAGRDWHACEILALGSRIRVAIDGQSVVDLEDTAGARQGIVAFRLGAGPAGEVRIKDLRLELSPEANLVTTGR